MVDVLVIPTPVRLTVLLAVTKPVTLIAPELVTVRSATLIALRFKVVAVLVKLTKPVESVALKLPTVLALVRVAPPNEVVINDPALIVPPAASTIAPPP